jgi:hypothetical protein
MTARFNGFNLYSIRLFAFRPGSVSPVGRKDRLAKALSFACCAGIMFSSLPGLISPSNAEVAGQPRQQTATVPQSAPLTAGKAKALPGPLKGHIVREVSPCPFREDHSTETIPLGTALNLTVKANLNSELSQVGDEVRAEVSTDLKDGQKVLLPGKWQVVGHVARVEKQRRLGRDGYIEIKFDKLVSPDGKWDVALDASASTRESTAKTVTRQVATTAGYTTVGAIGGSILSVQLTGLPVAVATHGLSVAAGAAVGGALGVIAALHRKGDILSATPGDEIQIRLPNPITIPAFKQELVPSQAPPPVLKDVDLVVRDFRFRPFPLGDKKSRLLDVSFAIDNNSKGVISFANVGVTCDHNHSYLPYCAAPGFFKERAKKVGPSAVQESTLTFQVGSPKLKYSLVILDQSNTNILSRVPIN